MNSGRPHRASRDDVVRLLGPLDDEDIVQLLAMDPTMAELEAAAVWLQGDTGDPMTPRIAGILEIVDRDEDEEPYPR